jgi:hypothetical protein
MASLRPLQMRCCRCELCHAEFDLPPILVNCYAGSPVAPTFWYDEWIVRYHGELAKDGVAVTTFASVLESVAAASEAIQPEPHLTLAIKPKTFGPAMRQARLLLHALSLPAACGAGDLFSSSIVGKCPPVRGLCYGHALELHRPQLSAQQQAQQLCRQCSTTRLLLQRPCRVQVWQQARQLAGRPHPAQREAWQQARQLAGRPHPAQREAWQLAGQPAGRPHPAQREAWQLTGQPAGRIHPAQ